MTTQPTLPTKPAVLTSCSYPVEQFGLPRAKLQAVSTADRPLCAVTAAYAASCLSLKPQNPDKSAGWDYYGVPTGRGELWARGILNYKQTGWSSYALADYAGLALSEYQKVTLDQLTVAGGVMSLGCGLGKTVTATAAAVAYSYWTQQEGASPGLQRGTRCWIVCPLNAIPAWQRFVPLLQQHFADVQVLSMDSAHKYCEASHDGGVIIFDEVHLLGVPTARRTKACHILRSRFDVGLCLTGTLLHGGIEKALSILDLAIPGAALFSSRWKAGEYFRCLVRKRIGSRTVTELVKPVGPARAAFLAYLSRYCVSLNSDSAEVRRELQLPDQDVCTVRLGEPWPAIEDAAVAVAQRVLNDTGDVPHMQSVAHELCRTGVSEKVAWLVSRIQSGSDFTATESGDDADTAGVGVPDARGIQPGAGSGDNDQSGPAVVVFAAYIETLDAIQSACDAAGITYTRVDGGVTGDKRAECERKFQSGEVQVFLGQMDAACVSMNLFRAAVSVSVDLTWRAANYAQALARTCRRGQVNKCIHIDLIHGNLQERVVRRLRAAEDFDASLSEWQSGKRAIDCLRSDTGPAGNPAEPRLA